MDLIYYYFPFLETIRGFIELGGNVLFVIGILTLFMWALIIERIVYLRVGHKKAVRTAVQIWESRPDHSSWNAHQIRHRLVSMVGRSIEKHKPHSGCDQRPEQQGPCREVIPQFCGDLQRAGGGVLPRELDAAAEAVLTKDAEVEISGRRVASSRTEGKGERI